MSSTDQQPGIAGRTSQRRRQFRPTLNVEGEALDAYDQWIADGGERAESSTVDASIVLIDPELATELLEGSKAFRNRKVNKRAVAAYAAAMTAGRWRLNGETIITDTSGMVINGQHRLLACIDAETSFPTVMVTGIERDDYVTLDDGKKRSASDALYMENFQYTTHTAAAIRALIQWDAGTFLTNYAVSNQEVLVSARLNPAMEESCRRAMQALHLFPKPSFIAFCDFLCSRALPEDAESFFVTLITGNNIENGSPISTLREKLIRIRIQSQGARSQKTGREELVWLVLRTFKAWLLGESLKRFSCPAVLGKSDFTRVDPAGWPTWPGMSGYVQEGEAGR